MTMGRPVLLAMTLVACGGIDEEIETTLATVSTVRGDVELDGERAAPIARARAGHRVETAERALARVSLDAGPQLLLGPQTAITIADGESVELASGRIFAEVQPGEQLLATLGGGALRAADASFDARIEGESARIYVIRGEVSWSSGRGRGIAAAGQELTLGGSGARTAPASLWDDWTGGLARPGPSDESAPAGVGTLEARIPDEIGLARWPLVIRRLDVRVRIERDLAITEVDQVFFNPASETVEGLYRIRVPEEAVLDRFAVDRDGRLVDGYVRERAQAARAYDEQVYQGSTEDPALLEWDAPGSYRARIYPIFPGETRRIVIRYAEWLHAPAEGAARLYRYPMGGGPRAPHVQELSISADIADAGAERVRAGMEAQVEEGAVRIRRSDFRPRADFWMELIGERDGQRAWTAAHEPPPRAPDAAVVANEADERDYFYLPLVLPESLATAHRPEGLDLIVVADVSAATDRSHLELGRSVVESLTAHLGEHDRLAIVSSDLRIRSVVEGEEAALQPASAENVERLLDGLARVPSGGATDLAQAIADAAALVDPARESAIVYVGDGTPTVGELGAEEMLDRIARLPHPIRLYAIAVGGHANLELLEALTHGGGMALRVEERANAGDAALRVLAHTQRTVAHGVEVSLGDGIDNAYPRRPTDAVLGDVFPIAGRVRGTMPASVTVTGTIAGQRFEEEIPIVVEPTTATSDLRLRWAGARLRQLLLDGAGREEVVELGTRYGLITPFTSYYVPSRNELARMGAHASRWIDRPILAVGRRHEEADIADVLQALALGPLAIVGCADVDRSAPVAEQEAPEWLQEEAVEEDNEGGSGQRHRDEEAAMGEQRATKTTNRYGIEGPADSPEPQMAREAAREQAANVGAIGVLRNIEGQQAPGSAAPMGAPPAAERPYGADVASGEAPTDAMGALMGDQVGSNFGFGGLGLRGTGRGGGGSGEGTIGLGNLGNIGHGGGSGTGSGYGRGAGGLDGRTDAVPRIRTGNADVRGSLSREVVRRVIQRHINEVRFCYEQELAQGQPIEGRVMVSFIISETGAVQSAAVGNTTLNNAHVEGCIVQAVRRWTFPAPEGGGVVGVNYPFVLSYDGELPARAQETEQPRVAVRVIGAEHTARRCSDAADLPLDDRRALWRERLGGAAAAHAWVNAYEEAVRDCEAETWRDRRAFLALILERAGGIESMLQVYSLLSAHGSRAFVRAQVLRRVRTPDELRQVRSAFGLGSGVDWTLVEQILARATTPDARIRALRRLSAQYPDSFDLKLQLLAALETARRMPEAKRLADRMRGDPLADPGVRTAIGEMFLRMGREDEARRVFSEIVEFAPLDELARRRLGDLYRAHGWYEDAYRQYETLAQIRPDDPGVMLLLAQAAAGAGRVDEALRLENRLMQTGQPGGEVGVARTALLWSSVRLARLRKTARDADDEARLAALGRRLRASGVLRDAGALRVTLVWSHPDAQIGLWAAHPGAIPTRPTDLAPEYGLEAFDLAEQEDGAYRIEVRREGATLTAISAQLVVVWNEGEEDEKIETIDLAFDREHDSFAWTIEGQSLASAEAEP